MRAFFMCLVLSAVSVMGGSMQVDSVPVGPAGTFLQLSPIDNCAWFLAAPGCGGGFFDPTIVDLSAPELNVHPGDLLQMSASGMLCYLPTICSTSPNVAAVFSSTAALLDASNLNRIPGAIATPGTTDVATNLFFSGASNTIGEDFLVPATAEGIAVTIPAGARYLFLGIVDSFYADNTGHVLVNLSDPPAPTPEPSTWPAMIAGLTALFALKKRVLARFEKRENGFQLPSSQ